MSDLDDFSAERPSTHGLSCVDVEDAHAAYVWGGLEPTQRAGVDAHRQRCSTCDERLLASERIISVLDQAHPRLAAPPDLRERVLAAIDRLPARAASSPVRHRDGASISRPPAVPETTARTGPHQMHPRRAGPVTRSAPWRAGPFLTGLGTGVLGTLAAAALIAVLLVRPEALDLIGGRQAQLNPGPADQAPQPPAFSIPGQPFASANRLLELRSSSETGRGLLAYDAHTRRGVLILEEVPSSASGSEYSVQLVQAARRVELGSVTIDARGVGTFILPDPLPLDRPERIEVIQTRPEPGAAPLVLAATF